MLAFLLHQSHDQLHVSVFPSSARLAFILQCHMDSTVAFDMAATIGVIEETWVFFLLAM